MERRFRFLTAAIAAQLVGADASAPLRRPSFAASLGASLLPPRQPRWTERADNGGAPARKRWKKRRRLAQRSPAARRRRAHRV